MKFITCKDLLKDLLDDGTCHVHVGVLHSQCRDRTLKPGIIPGNPVCLAGMSQVVQLSATVYSMAWSVEREYHSLQYGLVC